MSGMKNRDDEYIDLLRDYYAENGVLPSFAGIAALVGLKTTSAVSVMVGRLKEAGFLVSTSDRRLAPGPRFFERTEIMQAVRAGAPEVMVDGINDPVLIDRLLVDEPSRTVVVPIQGDSMIDAGLLDGDRVVVKRGVPSKEGDIVVAIVDGECTVKYLAKDDQGYYLKPGNPDYDAIRPKDELELYGRVTASFRRY